FCVLLGHRSCFSREAMPGLRLVAFDATRSGPGAPAPVLHRRLRHCRRGAFTLVQVMIAVGVIAICGLASIQALMLINRKAAVMRVMSSARAVVQRNIDTALGVPFSSTSQPAILAITTASGSPYDDDGNG